MSQLTLKEQASIPTATAAGEGAFWVENTAPSTPVFTDDAGTDRTLGITLGTEQASTSGTSIDFTSIPSGVKRITVMFYEVSLSGSDNWLIQLGDSGGLENSGYDSNSASFNATTQTSGTFTAGFGILAGGAANTFSGSYALVLEDSANNTWVGSGGFGITSGTSMNVCGGRKDTLTSVLDRIRITTVGGSDTFDAGAINIQYEF